MVPLKWQYVSATTHGRNHILDEVSRGTFGARYGLSTGRIYRGPCGLIVGLRSRSANQAKPFTLLVRDFHRDRLSREVLRIVDQPYLDANKYEGQQLHPSYQCLLQVHGWV